ncbi:hypothetical protein QYE76_040648 [Lolium multiflorum]|uniref:Glucan endo-1,3-beta-D-glucosidase n=1 Tax=Lolium multiflorum TaxID=4521 RepID=A0AAD8WTA4_LOLMU|nr:hypothetical protein QYE76_040648 [Lolium multiflorum]
MWGPRARAPLPCLWASPEAVAVGVSIGINYGKIADNLPSPSRVSWLVQPMQVAKVKLYNADHSILTVFHGSSLELIIGNGNEKLSAMIDMSTAHAWVQDHVLPYLSCTDTRITYITAGN